MIIEQGKFCEKEKIGLSREVILLNKRVDLKDTTIAILGRRIVLKDDIIERYVRNEQVFLIENNSLREVIKEDAKAIRRQKAKTVLFKITTVAAIIGGGYLLLKY